MGTERWQILLNLLVAAALQRRLSTRFSTTQKKLCCRNLPNLERRLQESSTRIRWFLMSRTFTRSLDQIQEWGELGFRTITHPLTSRISCKSILQRKTLKLFHTLHNRLILLPVTVLLFARPKRSLAGRRFKSRPALRMVVFQVLAHIPKEALSVSISTIDWATGKVCSSRRRILWKAEVENFPGCWVSYA